MARRVGWEDESITGKFKDDAAKYRGIQGEKHVLRVMTDCYEIRVHAVDNVLEPDKNGEPRVFNMTCSREWDEDAQDYVGECLGCDADYETGTKYVAGVLHLATYKGRSKTPQKIEPENAVMFWPFGGDKYRKLSDLMIELQRASKPKKLHQVEIVITCEDENFQKLNINLSQADPMTTKEHIAAWKEGGEKLVDDQTKGPSIAEQKRNLKRRKKQKKGDDNGADGGSRRASSKASVDSPSDDDASEEISTGQEDLDALLADL